MASTMTPFDNLPEVPAPRSKPTEALRTVIKHPKLSLLALTVILAVSIFLIGGPSDATNAHGKGSVANGAALRILPVGDSITEGYQSSDMNGYRLFLRKMLAKSGSKNVHFIGSLHHGVNNPENHHEGHGGWRIIQISDHLRTHKDVFEHCPNVILLHAGTNDVNAEDPPEEPYESAPERLGDLIDLLFEQCPDATMLVAEIINTPGSQGRVDIFNEAVPDLVAQRRKQGYKVEVVSHTNVGYMGEDLADGLHPNDRGYEIMADNWISALRTLPKGWITSPP